MHLNSCKIWTGFRGTAYNLVPSHKSNTIYTKLIHVKTRLNSHVPHVQQTKNKKSVTLMGVPLNEP